MSEPLTDTPARLSTPGPLSGVDPFAGDGRDETIEAQWFDQPASSRRITVPPRSSAPPPSIGDDEADLWFR